MLSQLLNRFFNQQDPKQAINQRLSEYWADWLKPISAEKAVGEDLTYHDSFQEIKEEVAKLSGIDYSLIIAESELILKTQSKDIRVATYYCLARLNTDGAAGFADGIELLAGLLDKFGTALYPSRQNIRKNAIEWLASAKFTDPLNKLQPIVEADLLRITAALNLIDQVCLKIFASDDADQASQVPNIDGLIQFFANGLKQPIKIESSEKQSISAPTTSPLAGEQTKVESTAIRSQRDLLEQARRMAVFLREKPDGYLVAGRLLRTLRWDTINDLPPADHRSKTRLPAPRTELKQHINRLLIQRQWYELFERAESAFMEGANHFWLDLQRATVTALQQMGEPHQSWSELFLADIGLMLGRLNGIERLSFDNGMPFADDDTLSWIAANATIHTLDGDESLAPISITGDNDWIEIEKQADELAQGEGIEKAFQWLQSLPAMQLPKQRYLLQYTQARVADKIGKSDIALKLLVGLNLQQQTMTLQQWEPVLLFDIKSYLVKMLKKKSQLKESNKPQLIEQIEQLHYELMQLDPARAILIQ